MSHKEILKPCQETIDLQNQSQRDKEIKQEEEKKGEFDPKEKSLIILTLNQRGSQSFTYLKEGQAGQREIYYIDHIGTGCITEATMLLGQFLFEFESYPEEALSMCPGGDTNRIYFPRDTRINDYNVPTQEETIEFISRMKQITKRKPEHGEAIQKIIDTL